MRITAGKSEVVAISSFDPFCRKTPELSAQSGNVPVLKFFWQAKKLKSKNQVVSPKYDFHVSGICPKTACWNLSHEERIFEFADEQFLESPVAVKSPDSFWEQIQISKDQSPVVGVALVGEQIPLGFFWFELDGTSDRCKVMLLFESCEGVGELCGFPTLCKFVISGGEHSAFEGIAHLGYDHISQPFSIERTDNVLVVKGTIQAHPRAAGRTSCGQFLQDLF